MKINFGEISIEKAEALTVYDAAAEAGIISRAVIAAKVNGEVRALTHLLDGDAEDAVKYILSQKLGKLAIIAYNEDIAYISEQIPNAKIYSLGSKYDKSEQAQLLFFTLREIDKESFDIIFAPLPEKDGIGLALYNRMIRAAAHSIINLRR